MSIYSYFFTVHASDRIIPDLYLLWSYTVNGANLQHETRAIRNLNVPDPIIYKARIQAVKKEIYSIIKVLCKFIRRLVLRICTNNGHKWCINIAPTHLVYGFKLYLDSFFSNCIRRCTRQTHLPWRHGSISTFSRKSFRHYQIIGNGYRPTPRRNDGFLVGNHEYW